MSLCNNTGEQALGNSRIIRLADFCHLPIYVYADESEQKGVPDSNIPLHRFNSMLKVRAFTAIFTHKISVFH